MSLLLQFQRLDSAFNAVTSKPKFLKDHPTVYISQSTTHYNIRDNEEIQKPLKVVCVWVNQILILDRRSEFIPSMWNNIKNYR